MVTEMGGIIGLFQPSERMIQRFKSKGVEVPDTRPDADAVYDKEVVIDLEGLGPGLHLPGRRGGTEGERCRSGGRIAAGAAVV